MTSLNMKIHNFYFFIFLFYLTPKGLRGVFSKKHSKTAISSSRSPTEIFFIFDRTDCEIIMFEVQRKVFFHCARQGQKTLTARGAKCFNYATLRFCTIIMDIMLGTCVPNLRGGR
jgi:hypothetical protein